jgi:hypothetical protein
MNLGRNAEALEAIERALSLGPSWWPEAEDLKEEAFLKVAGHNEALE